MFYIFKSKAQQRADQLVAQADPASAFAGLLMYVAKNPQASNNPKFIKQFGQLQDAWFKHYSETTTDTIGLDLSKQEHKLVCSAIAVITAAILEDAYTYEEVAELGTINIIKKEANLKNIPRVYADAYINFFKTETA